MFCRDRRKDFSIRGKPAVYSPQRSVPGVFLHGKTLSEFCTIRFYCNFLQRDDVIEHAIQCSNVPCREGEEPVNYPNICCPVCGKSLLHVEDHTCVQTCAFKN